MPPTFAKLLIAILFVLVLTPTPEVIYGYSNNAGKFQPRLNMIKLLRSLPIEERINLLSVEADYDLYVNSNNFHCVRALSKNTGFRKFMNDEKINMVVLSNELRQDKRYQQDEEWQSFLQDYQHLGYKRIEVLNSDRELLVKETLLKATSY